MEKDSKTAFTYKEIATGIYKTILNSSFLAIKSYITHVRMDHDISLKNS